MVELIFEFIHHKFKDTNIGKDKPAKGGGLL